VVLAARGARNLDQGEEKIADEASAAALRKKAKRIHFRAVIFALLLTILVLGLFLEVPVPFHRRLP
jgi:hypothetical protein